MASRRDPKATAETTTRKDKQKPTKAELRAVARKVRERFARARKAEHSYARHLRKIAAHVGAVVAAYAERGWVHERLAELVESLQKYAVVIEPWARAVASRMLADVARRDYRAWRDATESIGESLRSEIEGADVGAVTRALLADQVTLIKSLPIEAAERVHRLATAAAHEGGRADAISREIVRTGLVTRSRADLIARTETSRAQTAFTRARAEALGSEQFIWRTARDANVRDGHKDQEGKVFRWNNPPKTDSLPAYLPGCGPNCRCWAEPVFRD